jgi:ABC-2 type transport system ATP-binding protein
MITVEHLTRTYGSHRAVDDLSFELRPGVVTGFLGPNGAGKSTTMRMIMGLEQPTSGSIRIDGRSINQIPRPLLEIGSSLDGRSMHPGRSARNHLRGLAYSNGLSAKRVDEVLGLVGLSSVADRPAGKYSLGMGQRLGIAAALLGDPATLIFDEPVNGLDPEGILWVRNTLKSFATEGRSVLVSSHLMSEMALTATDLIVIGRGRLIADTTVEAFIDTHAEETILVRSPEVARLGAVLAASDVDIDWNEDGALIVRGLRASDVGDIASTHHITLHALIPQRASLEDVFMELTAESVEYHGALKEAI